MLSLCCWTSFSIPYMHECVCVCVVSVSYCLLVTAHFNYPECLLCLMVLQLFLCSLTFHLQEGTGRKWTHQNEEEVKSLKSFLQDKYFHSENVRDHHHPLHLCGLLSPTTDEASLCDVLDLPEPDGAPVASQPLSETQHFLNQRRVC